MSWFAAGQTVTRERRPKITDPHDPDHQIAGSWDDVDPDDDTLEITGAYVAQSSTAATGDATRTQVLTTLSLYVENPDADVLIGDRIISDGNPPLYVNARPDAPRSPFTGWQPVLEIPLDLSEG
jgi:hypothetical protein